MENRTIRKYQTSFFRRYLMLAFIIVFGYLLEVCVIPYIHPFGVSPNILFVMIGIVTVAYGKLRALWVGIIYGLLMEIMLPTVPYINIAIYPISTLFCSFAFADKPLKTLEYERATNKKSRELAPWLRTVLCTALNMTIYETVNITYIYIGGSPLTASHFLKAFGSIILTCLLCLILLFPLRRMILGEKIETLVLKSAPIVFRKS